MSELVRATIRTRYSFPFDISRLFYEVIGRFFSTWNQDLASWQGDGQRSAKPSMSELVGVGLFENGMQKVVPTERMNLKRSKRNRSID